MALGFIDNIDVLFVWTDDFTIRAYKDEEPILEINENTNIVIIVPLQDDYFCYGLETDIVGLYKGKKKNGSKKKRDIA